MRSDYTESKLMHMVDTLVLLADKGRGSLRQAPVS